MGSKCKATGLQSAISPKIYLLVGIPVREFQQVCWKINAVLGLWWSLFSHGPWANGSPCEQSLHLSSCVKRREGGTAWVGSRLWGLRSAKFWTSQSCSLLWNFFFRVQGYTCTWIIDKLMNITEPALTHFRIATILELFLPGKLHNKS